MNTQDFLNQDPSHPDTVTFYLQKGRQLRSQAAWRVVTATKRFFSRKTNAGEIAKSCNLDHGKPQQKATKDLPAPRLAA